MAAQTDWFSDLLQTDETILAAIGGPTDDHGWLQLAVTGQRILAVRLVAKGSGWQPAWRQAADKRQVQIAGYPRTDQSTARLELNGLGQPLRLLDIDEQSVFPYVQPFLAAWGGIIQGAGLVQARQPEADLSGRDDSKKLLAVLGIGVLMILLCGGCSGVGLLIRMLQ